jgi:hypothetical protein
MMDSLSTRITTTRLAGALCSLAFVAGCSSQIDSNPTSPSANATSSVARSTVVHPTDAVPRFYTAQISPTGVASGSNHSFSVTITNDPSTTSTQNMGSATVVVPSGFTITSAFTVTTTGVNPHPTPHPKTWKATTPVPGQILLQADPGSDKLAPGESVTVAFNATAPSLANCQVVAYEWTSVAYQDVDTQTAAYTLIGSQPSVTVTAACLPGCTLSQGYWKTRYPGNWPGSVLSGGLTLGTVNYTAAELESILNTEPAGGEGLLILAHQLIAAKLNVANGADSSAIASTIAAANAMIGGLVVPPVGSGSLPSSTVSALATTLQQFNEGLIGPGHCPN